MELFSWLTDGVNNLFLSDTFSKFFEFLLYAAIQIYKELSAVPRYLSWGS